MTEQTQEQMARSRQVGRFTLSDLVEDRAGAQVWRAVDNTLNREVGLWLLPLTDDRVPDLDEATRTAAAVPDRRVLRVLDVFRTETLFVVVTEWSHGQVLRDNLVEPLAAAESARIAFEIARAVESAHANGIAHGRIRPSNVLIADDGEVRLSGLGIDAVLSGIEPTAQGDPILADVHGVGSILYACLTTRWPDADIREIPSAPEVGGHVPPPSRILADVPESLDDVCARSVLTIAPPRGRPELVSVTALRELLGSVLTDLTGQRRAHEPSRRPRRIVPRALAALGALLLMAGVGYFGWRMVNSDEQANAQPTTAPGSKSAKAKATPTPTKRTTTYRIAAVDDFDPLGNGEESPARVPLSYDGNKTTAWRTVTYYDKGLDGKPGLGLLIDLGAPRSISDVRLDLVGNGTDLQVLTSNDRGDSPKDYDLMAQATEAGETVTLRSPRPKSARYVLVWFTGLPQVDGGWRGGVRELRVRG